jgi:hypothetical protein
MVVTPWMQRLGANRRLWWLVAAALAVVALEGALRGWEQHQQTVTELREVRNRIAALAASSDQVDWAGRTAAVEAARKALAAQLWHSPSEAQAQARLRDWLTAALRTAGVQRPTLSLLPAQTLPAPTGAPAGGAAASNAPRVLRVRASVVFELGPNALERALHQIEGGGQLARVDNLIASTRSRRVEMQVSVPVLLQPEGS